MLGLAWLPPIFQNWISQKRELEGTKRELEGTKTSFESPCIFAHENFSHDFSKSELQGRKSELQGKETRVAG